MPSHPDRVRQNNCDHQYEYMPMSIREMVFDGTVKDDRKCLKCGKAIGLNSQKTNQEPDKSEHPSQDQMLEHLEEVIWDSSEPDQ